MTETVLWVVLAAVLIVIELNTTQMICLWFAIGALFGALASFVGAPLPLQILIFLVCSVVSLFAGRPLLNEKILPKKSRDIGAERIIGKTGVVQEEINNRQESGRVYADGLLWTARSEDGTLIPAGTNVLVLRLEGVKLIVKPKLEAQTSQPPVTQEK